MSNYSLNWKGLPSFSGTGIGSVPFLSPERACQVILEQDYLIPFWPQMVRVGPREEMLIQFSPPLPCLQPDLENRTVRIDPSCNRSQALLDFYEKFLSGNLDFFALRPDFASGFFALIHEVQARKASAPYLKGQIVGPVTLGLSLKDENDRLLIHDPELMDAVIKGLACQGLSQVEQLAALGKKALLFIDEPSLSGYGSAFTPLSRSEVLDILGETIRLIREKGDALIGLHCCGNTDWSLLLSLDLDLINLDAFAFGEAFLLYPREIRTFLEQDRAIAWGIVPTLDYTGRETPEALLEQLNGYFESLIRQGIDPERLHSQALLTPACGLGTLAEKTAADLLHLLNEVCHLARNRFSAQI
jgi:methionine synthase II (cobalamin-independent)